MTGIIFWPIICWKDYHCFLVCVLRSFFGFFIFLFFLRKCLLFIPFSSCIFFSFCSFFSFWLETTGSTIIEVPTLDQSLHYLGILALGFSIEFKFYVFLVGFLFSSLYWHSAEQQNLTILLLFFNIFFIPFSPSCFVSFNFNSSLSS